MRHYREKLNGFSHSHKEIFEEIGRLYEEIKERKHQIEENEDSLNQKSGSLKRDIEHFQKNLRQFDGNFRKKSRGKRIPYLRRETQSIAAGDTGVKDNEDNEPTQDDSADIEAEIFDAPSRLLEYVEKLFDDKNS